MLLLVSIFIFLVRRRDQLAVSECNFTFISLCINYSYRLDLLAKFSKASEPH
jgi:hypothetical protein